MEGVQILLKDDFRMVAEPIRLAYRRRSHRRPPVLDQRRIRPAHRDRGRPARPERRSRLCRSEGTPRRLRPVGCRARDRNESTGTGLSSAKSWTGQAGTRSGGSAGPSSSSELMTPGSGPLRWESPKGPEKTGTTKSRPTAPICRSTKAEPHRGTSEIRHRRLIPSSSMPAEQQHDPFDIFWRLREARQISVRHGRARLTISRSGEMSEGDLGPAIKRYEKGEIDAEDLAWAFVRTRVVRHTPSFNWDGANLPSSSIGSSVCRTNPLSSPRRWTTSPRSWSSRPEPIVRRASA